jgi:hypothetical protein
VSSQREKIEPSRSWFILALTGLMWLDRLDLASWRFHWASTLILSWGLAASTLMELLNLRFVSALDM